MRIAVSGERTVNPRYPVIRVLVFGGRTYPHEAFVHEELLQLTEGIPFENVTVIHGDANREKKIGADYYAHTFCELWRNAHAHTGGALITELAFPAKWDDLSAPGAVVRRRSNGAEYNVIAGFTRNQQMLSEGKPTHARGFPGGAGTADMRNRIVLANKDGANINLKMHP